MISPKGLGIGRCRSVGVAAALVVALALALSPQTGPVRAQTATAEAPKIPDPYKLNMLIRTTLIALNQANRTGNYTVLRDLSAPAFARTNDAARLAEIFAKLRKRGLDISPILFFQPKLRGPAKLTDNGLLRLTGYFETKPEQISFDMLFQPVSGDWLLFGLAVDVAPPKAADEKPAASSDKRSSVEPAVRQDSAPLPRKASVPAPARRPQPRAEEPAQQAFETTTEEDRSEDGSSDSFWSLWGQ
jgi:hypothetical protein